MTVPEIRYLFRYRNLLTDDTLGEHRKIITEHHMCWWGWWQRPAEDARIELWNALAKELEGGPIQIGLFNSAPEGAGAGSVHVATLDQVLPPSSEDGPVQRPPKYSQLVPDYYRQTPFSSAWMRLIHIAEDALDDREFYGNHSFRSPPVLRGMIERDTRRYTGKVILDADELRSMDTTLWEVRSATTGDPSDRILATSSRVTAAVSSDPIPLRHNRVLHLSDLHFGVHHRWDLIGQGQAELHSRIVTSLGSDPKVGLVVISGDLTHRAERSEFYEAFRFIHALLGGLRLGPEHLVVIPGNHDIAWTQQEAVWDPSKEVSQASEEAMYAYREAFYRRVFRHPPSPDLSMARRFVAPCGLVLDVCALNTSALEQGRRWLAGMGRVGDGAFQRTASKLGWVENDSTASLRMLVLHHHLTPTEDVMPTDQFGRGFGMASDARRTLRDAARYGVQLVLHGHRHLPFLSSESVYESVAKGGDVWNLGRVGIVGGGSAGSTETQGDENHFNILDLTSTSVSLQMYTARSPEDSRGPFTMPISWSSDLRLENGRLKLDDWKRK